MIQTVQARTPAGALLTLPLRDASEGLAIKEIQGLEPVKATIVTSSFAGSDGSQYQSSRREERNTKLILDLEPDYITTSVEDLRDRLYGFFMTKRRVSLGFTLSSGLFVEIWGRVESFDAPLFTDEPRATISLMHMDPDFINPVADVVAGNTTDLTTESDVAYAGTVETGIKFTLNVDRTLTAFTIYHRTPDDDIRTLDFAAPLAAGDVLEISTVPGSKYATLTRGGTESSILYGVAPYANWIALEPGTNYLRVYAEGAAVPYTIEYNARYGGL